MRTTVAELVTDGLAAHRLTQLVVDDLIAARPRRAVDKWLAVRGYHLTREGLRCSWCVGIWAGLAVTGARLVAPDLWKWAARALAAADIAGMTAEVLAGAGE